MSAKHFSGNGSTIPAVAYIRMSSDRQDLSPGQQRDEIAKLAARGGFHLVREYFDDAVSGDATEKRTAFQRMIRDAERGDVQGDSLLGPGPIRTIRQSWKLDTTFTPYAKPG